MSEESRPKASVVLEFLLAGHEMDKLHDGYIYTTCEAEDDRGVEYRALVIKMKKFKEGQNPGNWDEGEDEYMGSDMTVTAFIALCEQIDDEDIFLMGATCVLDRVHHRKPTKRGFEDHH